MPQKKQRKVEHHEAQRVVDILSDRLNKLEDSGNEQPWFRGICVVVEKGGNHHVEVRVSRSVLKALEFFYPELEIDGVPIRVKEQPLAMAL